MSDIQRFDVGARMSDMAVHNGVAYLAGQVASDATGDAQAQTADVLAQVDALLARAGTDKSRLLSVQVWLKTMDDFDAMNAVYDAWVVPGNTPCRACGKVELADPAYRIEVIAIAARH